MKNKLSVLFVGLILCSMFLLPNATADVTVTGTFDVTGDLEVTINETDPDFGSLAVGETGVVKLQLENTGNVTATCSQQAASADGGSSMSVVAYASLDDEDVYSVGISIADDGDYADTSTTPTIVSGLVKGATHDYALNVTIGTSLGSAAYNDEAFSADITVTEG